MYNDGENVGGSENVFIGAESGGGTWATGASDGNTAVGWNTMKGAMNGAANNTAVGKSALAALTIGDGNTVIGAYAGQDNTEGGQNIYIGYKAGTDVTLGDYNTVIGYQACLVMSGNGANYNTVVGHEAGKAITSGAYNTIIGQGAGDLLTTTDDNVFVCREIPFMQSHKASDPDSLEYATETDPVFYYEPQTDGTAVKIKVLPASSSNVAKVYSVDYPVFDADGSGTNTNIKTATSIANFPNEVENLIVLRAAISAAEYQLAIEEDVELYTPIIALLKSQYQEGVMVLKTGNIVPPQQQKAR